MWQHCVYPSLDYTPGYRFLVYPHRFATWLAEVRKESSGVTSDRTLWRKFNKICSTCNYRGRNLKIKRLSHFKAPKLEKLHSKIRPLAQWRCSGPESAVVFTYLKEPAVFNLRTSNQNIIYYRCKLSKIKALLSHTIFNNNN